MSTGVMLAFLPTDGSWCQQPLPHLTLVYAGSIEDLPVTAFNDLAKDAITVARQTRPFSLDVTGIDQFGEGSEDNPSVDVLTLKPIPSLLAARHLVDGWNASQHPFNPHCTIGPEGSAQGNLPVQLYFDRILVAWGNRNIVFNLGDYPSEATPSRY
jgi:2'-5' RNA ligase